MRVNKDATWDEDAWLMVLENGHQTVQKVARADSWGKQRCRPVVSVCKHDAWITGSDIADLKVRPPSTSGSLRTMKM